MENNIKIFDSQELGVRAVSARVLYSELTDGDMSHYSRWAKKNIIDNEYADSGCDFITRHNGEYSGRGQKATDYVLALDFAKELCMMSKCEKGKIIRKYFIECEKKLKQQPTLPNFNNPAEAARAWADQYEKNQKLLAENTVMKPKAEDFDALVDRNCLLNFRDTAKELGQKQNQFINWLIDNKFIYRDKTKTLKPYACYMDYFSIKEYQHDGYTGSQTLITPHGREAFRLLLSK